MGGGVDYRSAMGGRGRLQECYGGRGSDAHRMGGGAVMLIGWGEGQ